VKDYLRQILSATPAVLPRLRLVREYLQARILQALQEEGVFLRWAFQGGTALRFLYNIPRFSEDLGFSSTEADTDAPSIFARAVQHAREGLGAEGYAVDARSKDQKAVASAFLRFLGLLHELDLSPQASAVLSIKIELDTRPPAGAGLETTVVRRHVLLRLQLEPTLEPRKQ